MGCVDDLVVLKLTEKRRETRKKLYAMFMDLEKEYDKVRREEM